MHYFIIARVLVDMGVNLPQRKFLLELFTTWLAVRGRFNYRNISRYGSLHERTLRRWFKRGFSWPEFHRQVLEHAIPAGHELIAALDASFVPKSGKQTAELGYFFNGCAGRVEKGLELSLVSVVDVTRKTAYALSAIQTPLSKSDETQGKKTQGKKTKAKKGQGKKTQPEETRMDHYLKHFGAVRSFLPPTIRHLAVDGYYTSAKFVAGVCGMDLDVVGKLRHDANLRYLYHGPQSGRGRPRLYAGKVQWLQLDKRRWKSEGCMEPGVRLYSASLYHASLKRVIRVALLQEMRAGKLHYVLFYSTDLQLSGRDIMRYYSARFQIEFLFRDAKQTTGLSHCQARQTAALEFHWNAAFSAVNLAKWQQRERSTARGFSVASHRQRCSNQRLIQVFSTKLGLDLNQIKSHPAYTDICNYGVISS